MVPKSALDPRIASSIVEKAVTAKRGTIYDRNHTVIAQQHRHIQSLPIWIRGLWMSMEIPIMSRIFHQQLKTKECFG